MKKTLITVLIAFNTLSAFAQSLKNHTGDLKGGNQTFSYYENSKGDFIKHGKFNYEKKEKGFSKLISGEFKDGKRNGLWTFSKTMINYETNDETSYSGSKKMSISYSEGLPNGKCTYTDNLKVRYAKYVGGTKHWGAYGKSTNSDITLNYKSGILVGKFNINDGIFKKISTGNFNSLSFANGQFITTDNLLHTKTTATYLNGKLTKFNDVDLRTDKSNYSLSSDKILNQLHLDFSVGKIKPENLYNETNYYKIDTVHSIAPIKTTIETFIYSDDFLFYEIGGDLNYNAGEIAFGGNNAVILSKYGYQTFDKDYRDGNNAFNRGDYSYAVECYKRIKLSKEHLSPKDKNILAEKIKVSEEKNNELLAKKKKEEEAKLKQQKEIYENLIMKGNDLFDKGQYIESSQLYSRAVKSTKNTELNNEAALKRLQESRKLAEEQRIAKENELKEAQTKLIQLYNNSKPQDKEIKDLYVVKDVIRSRMSGKTEYKIKKKRLYSVYEHLSKERDHKIRRIYDFTVVMHVGNTIKSITDLNKILRMISILEDSNKLYEKMKVLVNEETKNLEKLLKKNNDSTILRKLILD